MYRRDRKVFTSMRRVVKLNNGCSEEQPDKIPRLIASLKKSESAVNPESMIGASCLLKPHAMMAEVEKT